METVNGFTIIARAFDRNGHSVILAVRESLSHPGGFEYVSAWHNAGDNQWWAGHYSGSYITAFSEFQQRVSE